MQVVDGVIYMALPSFEGLQERLELLSQRIGASTPFRFRFEKGEESLLQPKCIITGPFGNHFVVECTANGFPDESVQNHHFIPQRFLGIHKVEVRVRQGTAMAIARFYQQVMRALVRVGKTSAEVYCGPFSRVVYRERQDDEAELVPYSGWHFAMYVADFSGTYKRCKRVHATYNNPRFRDQVHSLSDALHFAQFRLKDIRDPEEGPNSEVVLELEHEIRSTAHESFMRPLVNRFEHPLHF